MGQPAAPDTGKRSLRGRPSIRAIGAIAGGLALIATAVLIAVTYVGWQERSHSFRVVEREQDMARFYADGRTAAIGQGAAGLSYFVFGEAKYLDDLDISKENLKIAVHGLVGTAPAVGPEEAQRADEIHVASDRLDAGLETFLDRLEQGDGEGALQLVAEQDIEGQFRRFNDQLELAADDAHVRLEAAQQANSATQARWSNITIAVSAIWALMTLISTAVLLQWVARPVARVARAAHALKAGDLSIRVTADGLRETHELATAFNAMAARVQESTEQLRVAATTDDLTGIPNHRSLMETLDREIERSIRYQHPLTVVMMDIDAFKHFNDAYGHQAGDDVLRQVADLLRSSTRNVDIMGRYGGDEFLGILPEANRTVAIAAANRILRAFTEARFRIDDSHEVQVAMSLGIAVCPDDSKDKRELLAHADIALYEAKTEAGNSLRVARRSAA
ncbi:MAG: diguanylate cyclase [Dehalococcoidia bacterium]